VRKTSNCSDFRQKVNVCPVFRQFPKFRSISLQGEETTGSFRKDPELARFEKQGFIGEF
jgi:hypothetical protein